MEVGIMACINMTENHSQILRLNTVYQATELTKLKKINWATYILIAVIPIQQLLSLMDMILLH